MTQLDQPTRQALCALDQPPPGMEDRVFAAIVQTTGGGGGGGTDGGGGTQLPVGGESALVYAAKVVGATLGLTAAGFALVAASAVGVRSLRTSPHAKTTDSAVVVTTPGVETTPATTDRVAISEPEAEPANDTVQPASAPPREREDIDRKPTPAPAPSLEAELALLELARTAPPREALAALEQHRLEFERGMLVDEREVLRVETLCALGRAAEAQTAAADFLAAHPESPLRSRLEPACDKS
jgi:hypothetical protein